MAEDSISEIGIIQDGRLYLRPSRTAFDHIYRAAMEVHWDPVERRLFSPVPRKWSYARWFSQIVAAAAGEYGVHLRLTSDTEWVNVPEPLRAEIKSLP